MIDIGHNEFLILKQWRCCHSDQCSCTIRPKITTKGGRGLPRISTGKVLQWRGLGHSVNCWTLKTKKVAVLIPFPTHSLSKCTTASQPQSLAIFWIAGEIARNFRSQKQIWPFSSQDASQPQPYRYRREIATYSPERIAAYSLTAQTNRRIRPQIIAGRRCT